MAKIKIFKGKIYKLYFESMEDPIPDPTDADKMAEYRERIQSCQVLATNLEEAIRKAHRAFPGEVVGSCFTERNFTERHSLETILL